MPRIPGVPHQRAIAALQRAGFKIIRQGKHVIMSNGVRTVVVPRANPVHAVTMGIIVRDSGLSVERFKSLL